MNTETKINNLRSEIKDLQHRLLYEDLRWTTEQMITDRIKFKRSRIRELQNKYNNS